MKRFSFLVSVVLSGSLLLSGCGRNAAGSSPSGPAQGTDTVVVAMDPNSEPASGFDPAFGWGAGEHVHEPLIQSTLTVTNNYTGGITLQGLTANVVVEHVEEDGTVTDATALMYILPQRTAPSILQPGQTATLTWKLIPGEGMGGENGIKYQVRADVGYTVVTPGEDGEEPVSKPVQTSTQAVEITVNPQPSLTVDYFLPHKVYPGEPFNLDVVVINSGHGPAQNVVLDSSQLEIVENKSGLVGTWQIVGTSFGPTSGSGPTTSFRVTLGDVPAGQTVKGYYTIRWDLPTGAGGLGDDVYGEVLNFTATLTHKPYEGVELNPLITAVYTHIVGKDQVTIKDESQTEQTVKVIMGDHGLPAFLCPGPSATANWRTTPTPSPPPRGRRPLIPPTPATPC